MWLTSTSYRIHIPSVQAAFAHPRCHVETIASVASACMIGRRALCSFLSLSYLVSEAALIPPGGRTSLQSGSLAALQRRQRGPPPKENRRQEARRRVGACGVVPRGLCGSITQHAVVSQAPALAGSRTDDDDDQGNQLAISAALDIAPTSSDEHVHTYRARYIRQAGRQVGQTRGGRVRRRRRGSYRLQTTVSRDGSVSQWERSGGAPRRVAVWRPA